MCGLLPKDRYRTDGFQARIPRTQPCAGKFALCRANSTCAYKQNTKKSTSFLCEGSGPIVPVIKNFVPLEGPASVRWRCYNWPTKFPKKDVKWKLFRDFFVGGTVATSEANHCWHANIEIFQPRIYRSCLVLQYPTICRVRVRVRPARHGFRAWLSCLVPLGKREQCAAAHHTSRSSQYAS